MPSEKSYDLVIIGGGVIGLSIAYELSKSGARICLLDRGEMGNEASWAGAGILPPGAWYSDHPLLDQLTHWSHELYPVWSSELKELTGIDNQHRACGGTYLCHDGAAEGKFSRWKEQGIECRDIKQGELPNHEPAIRIDASTAAYHIPAEAQVRNPRHLAALVRACKQRGVALRAGSEVVDLLNENGRIVAVQTTTGHIPSGAICLTAGCWSGQISAKLGLNLPIKPIRGQMLLLHSRPGLLRGNIHYRDRYLAPRTDGRLLVGSTVEDAGFDKSTTHEALDSLRAFAAGLCPALSNAEVELSWSGLRPATADQLPYLGPIPGFENAWIAAGHYRSGLQLAPPTAILMSQLIRGSRPAFDLNPFSVDR